MSKLARENGIIALTPTADHSDYSGYAVKASSGNAALVAATTDEPIGVILVGDTTDGKDSVALCAGLGGTVKVKLDGTPGTVALGTKLVVTATGTWKEDPSSGTARVIAAIALEAGAADELIEAVLLNPVSAS